ncbi:MAG: hypothetical protein IJL50_07430, partial [Bacteroidaceae bacterium]|nr:hypothetical protein [Bacteroidaceae bacterium]
TKDMKNVKITNYTTKDWLKQMGVGFCIIGLGMFAIRSFLDDKDYIASIAGLVGLAGWCVVDYILRKDIEKRNPQE